MLQILMTNPQALGCARSRTRVIFPEQAVSVEGVTGFEGKPPAGPVQVPMRDMGTGDSQVLLVRLNVGSGASGRRPVATVELRYRDLFSKKDGNARQSVVADGTRLASYDPTWDAEVLRNVTIQRTAEGMKEIAGLYKSQRYQEAWELANRLEKDLWSVARLANDAQIIKDADLMRKYQETLARLVEKETGRPPKPAEGGNSGQPAGEQQGAPASSASTIEVN